MGRPVKDYWNWVKISIPAADWRDTVQREKFLTANTWSQSHYEIRADKEFSQPRTRRSNKHYTIFHYYIKDPMLASVFKLKFC